jgi:hypothetical protein
VTKQEVVRWYAIAVGVVLVLVGLLGFVNNPIVGEPGALFVTGTVHNIVHLVTGAIALYIGFGLRGDTQVNALIGFGILYLIVLVGTLVSPNLFGILGDNRYNVSTFDHVLHLVLAVAAIGVGWWARTPERLGA